MKTVTVRRTFENEGQIVRPARGDADPVRITVSETRARQLMKSGLVDEPEDAPEPTAAELEELAVRGFASASVDSSDSNVITIRVRTSRQADAVRAMLRELAEKAKAHVGDRKAAGDIVGDDETAASVLFSDNRSAGERTVIQSADPAEDPPADDAPAEDPPADDPPSDDPPADDPPADDPPADDPPADDPPADDPPAEDPPAEDPPAPRRPRGNRTPAAAT